MRRSPLLPIFLIVLVDVLGLTIVIPLLGPYAETFHATPFVAALLVPTYAACQMISGPFLGRWSDRIGRKPVLVISQLGTLAGFVLMARASALWMVFVARVLDGATAGNLSIAQAYIADNTKPEDRTKSFALIGIAFGLGFTVGPAVPTFTAAHGMNAAIWVAAALSATSVLCTTFLLPTPPKAAAAPTGAPLPGGERLGILQWGAYAAYFRRPVLRGLLLQFFAYMFAFSTFNTGFPLFAERAYRWDRHAFTTREIGIAFAYAGLIGIVLQGGLLGRLVRRFGERALAFAAFASLCAGYVVLATSVGSLALLGVATTLSAIGNAMLRPSLTSLITQTSQRGEQGVVLGLTQSLMSVASISAAPLAGALIDRHWLPAWALVAAGFAGAGVLLAPLGSWRATTASPSRPA